MAVKKSVKKEDEKNNKLEELTAKKEAEIIEKQEQAKEKEMSELEKRKTTFLSDLLSVEKGKDIGTLLSFNTGVLSILCII